MMDSEVAELLMDYDPMFVSEDHKSAPVVVGAGDDSSSHYHNEDFQRLGATGGADTYYEDFMDGIKKFVADHKSKAGGAANTAEAIFVIDDSSDSADEDVDAVADLRAETPDPTAGLVDLTAEPDDQTNISPLIAAPDEPAIISDEPADKPAADKPAAVSDKPPAAAAAAASVSAAPTDESAVVGLVEETGDDSEAGDGEWNIL